VVNRWSDRIMVTALKNVKWDDGLVEDIVRVFEDISRYIEGHSHPDESIGAPPRLGDLNAMIDRVEGIVKRAKGGRP
jgi:hypothetical protein